MIFPSRRTITGCKRHARGGGVDRGIAQMITSILEGDLSFVKFSKVVSFFQSMRLELPIVMWSFWFIVICA